MIVQRLFSSVAYRVVVRIGVVLVYAAGAALIAKLGGFV